jgi:hypothetical protein
MDCPHSTPDAWLECRNPNGTILRAKGAWKVGRFRGKSGLAIRQWRCRHALLGWFAFSGRDSRFVGDRRTRGSDGYYEVSQQVCIYRRRSRLLWGSGNARRNRMGVGYGNGARFLNRDSWDVGVLEKRWMGRWKRSRSPTASTGGDARYAMPLWWMRGNCGVERYWSGDGVGRFSTGWQLGAKFAANPQNAVGCGGMVRQ